MKNTEVIINDLVINKIADIYAVTDYVNSENAEKIYNELMSEHGQEKYSCDENTNIMQLCCIVEDLIYDN